MKIIVMFVVLFGFVSFGSCAVNAIRDLLQRNVFGVPDLHKEYSWPFDPEEGIRRSRQYQEINGRLGEKAIERLGLGIDGFDRERLAKQRERDAKLFRGDYNYFK